MGFERIAIYGLIDLDLESTGVGSVVLSTDIPGNAMAVRETKTIPVTGRRILRFRLLGTTKGHLYSLRVNPGAGVIRLYAARMWVRVLPDLQWAWVAVPIPETGDWVPQKLPIPPVSDWQPEKLPIPETSEWEASKLPIPATSEWEPSKLPIPETSEWSAEKLPIAPTPPVPQWVDVPVDQ